MPAKAGIQFFLFVSSGSRFRRDETALLWRDAPRKIQEDREDI